MNNVHTFGMRFDKTERRANESNKIDSGGRGHWSNALRLW
jgi:hypothetical protein